jgi:hypothetical protein
MIHIATIHWQTDRWIDVQLQYLQRQLDAPYRVYASLCGVEGDHAGRFYFSCSEAVHKLVAKQMHARNLNRLAARATREAAADDLLLFLDGDAFPIAELLGPVRAMLESAPLAAIRRDENLQDPQPHPSFCATTVGFWREIGGDWSPGYQWRNAEGDTVTDPGANLLKMLQERNIPWTPILRSNVRDLHPVLFGVYGNLVYHHGAGFRPAMTRRDEIQIKRRVEAASPTIRAKLKRDLWTTCTDANKRLSDLVFQKIQSNERFAEELFLTPGQNPSGRGNRNALRDSPA